jgi:hypothetical protein
MENPVRFVVVRSRSSGFVVSPSLAMRTHGCSRYRCGGVISTPVAVELDVGRDVVFRENPHQLEEKLFSRCSPVAATHAGDFC